MWPCYFACACAIVGPSARAGYQLTELEGLTGPGYENAEGYRESFAVWGHDSDRVAGFSNRFSADSTSRSGGERQGWLYDGSGFTEIGLSGPGFISAAGNTSSEPQFVSASGHIFGESNEYAPASRSDVPWVVTPGGETLRLGFSGPGYTSVRGRTESRRVYTNAGGWSVGYSERYSPGDVSSSGREAWLFNGTEVLLIGLDGSGYLNSEGVVTTQPRMFSETGAVIGTTEQYPPPPSGTADRTAWLHDQGQTIPLGLTGPEFSGSAGLVVSFPYDLNESSQVTGVSNLYDASGNFNGRAAWLYDAGQTRRLGLWGTGYQTANGYATSSVYDLTESGYTAGISQTFSPTQTSTASLGGVAWIDNGQASQAVGFYGPQFTASSGATRSSVDGINDAGAGIGTSQLVDPSTGNFSHTVTWVARDTQTVVLGLQGAEFVEMNGFTTAYGASFIQSNGWAYGYTSRVDSVDPGVSLIENNNAAFVFDGEDSRRIGLRGTGYTNGVDFSHTSIERYSDSEAVSGTSRRYDPASTDIGGSSFNRVYANLGQDAWVDDGQATTRIGLISEGYISQNEIRYSKIGLMNRAGDVAGLSYRYDSEQDWFSPTPSTYSGPLGATAWVYDSVSEQTHELLIDQRDDGYARSTVWALTEVGTAYGDYDLYDDTDGSLVGPRAFRWSREEGVVDLSTLWAHELASAGLSHVISIAPIPSDPNILLGRAVSADGLDRIVPILINNLVAVIGDYNADGFVGQGDLDLVLLNWGDTVLPGGFDESATPGGGPFDGLVSQNELDEVLLKWGMGTPPSWTEIPEPSTLTAATLLVLAGFTRRFP